MHLKQIIQIRLTKDHAARALVHAGQAEIGGKSNVRKAKARADELANDQFVGQLGQVGLHMYLYGNLVHYEAGRWMQNQFPNVGDGGFDIPGALVDVKTSLVRTDLPLLEHRLPVRPKERHDNAVYILALLQSPYVNLIGWASDAELPDQPEFNGPFQGAYVLKAHELNPLMPIQYAWVA